MDLQKTNLLGFPSFSDEPALKEYPAKEDALLGPTFGVPKEQLSGKLDLDELKRIAKEEREKKIIESLPGIFSRNGWPTAANMMHYWLHGRSFDGKRRWDYERSNIKGVKLRDEEVCKMIMKFERLKAALLRLHKKVAEPENIKKIILGDGFGVAADNVEKSVANLYARFKNLPAGSKELVHWGEKVEYPDLYLEKEEVDYYKFPAAENHYYPVFFDDLSVSLGRFGIRAYASGELVKKEDKEGYFSVSALGFRIFDQFKFQVSSSFGSDQFLGNWSEKGPEAWFESKGIYLTDSSFVNYKKRNQKGADFLIYSKIYTFKEISALCNGLNLTSPPEFSIPLSDDL